MEQELVSISLNVIRGKSSAVQCALVLHTQTSVGRKQILELEKHFCTASHAGIKFLFPSTASAIEDRLVVLGFSCKLSVQVSKASWNSTEAPLHCL